MAARFRFALQLFVVALVIGLGMPWIDQWLPTQAGDAPPSSAPATAAAPGEKSPQSAGSETKSAAQPMESEGKADGGGSGRTRPVAALTKGAPESAEDLAAIQNAIEEVVKKDLPATVGVDINGVEGSGVIVTEDGYVLTAGHVSGMPGRDAYVILPDGKRVKAITLGANESVDSGMMKISEPGPWPHAEMGRSATLKPGEWCVALGHPGGFQRNRPPPVRAGRLILVRSDTLWTDCPLTAGDSGGPLFDSQGRVIGIHSRISDSLIANYHVPIDNYRESWERLAKGETWGGDPPRGGPMLGISGESHEKGCQVLNVFAGSAAAKAGLRVDDIITELSGENVTGIEGLQSLVAKHKVGEEVTLTVLRDGRRLQLKANLDKRE